ncbi:putative reverse transcriptase domain-containing protein [Tanacetum coccineum]|uniref:Reverse transcriptase domain-containing protein n=1 Tax=Tanacetum coccineum TaxID=301880 RepID=A0ABQ4XX23_9ASTR
MQWRRVQILTFVTHEFSLNDHFVTVLFDSGADFSFISTEFVPLLNVKPSIVNPGYVIEVADGKKVEVDRIIRVYKLELESSLFSINLIPLGRGSFDMIVGMDWLSQHKAVIVCHEKVVEIPVEDGRILRVHGERTVGIAKVLKSMKKDEPKLGDIPIVRDFEDVFPEDLSGLPPQQQEVDIIKKTENQAKMTKLSMEWKRLLDNDDNSYGYRKHVPTVRLSSIIDGKNFTLSDESFSEEDIPKENFIIFSNPLFDLDEEIASTKVDRINDEVLESIHSIPPGIDSFDAESDLVESMLNRDISIDSSPKIDSLSNEFAGELILPKSIPPEIEEVEFDPEGDILFLESLLYDNSSPRPPEALQANSNDIESLPPSHIPVADNDSLMEEIDLFLADDGSIPPGIESDDVDSVDDDTSISLPEFESFYVDYPNSGNSTIDVVEDIPVDVPNVLPTHPILEQDFIPTSIFFAYVVWIFLPFLFIPVIPPYLLSCGDEDTIFDPGISKDCPDCEDSQFCHSSRVSHPQLHLGIRYPNLID